MNFEKSFTLLISNEGCFTLSAKDSGNWTGGREGSGKLKGTKYGISAASYPHLDIENLSLTMAKEIYKRDFWDKCRADELPEQIRFDVFDTAVNSGVSRAIKLLQRAVGVQEDGIIGPKTLAAAANLEGFLLDKRFNATRLLYITELSISAWSNFGRGWVTRIANNMLKD